MIVDAYEGYPLALLDLVCLPLPSTGIIYVDLQLTSYFLNTNDPPLYRSSTSTLCWIDSWKSTLSQRKQPS